MANPFVHIELGTDDPQKAKQFYSELFKWQTEESPNPVSGGVYTFIKTGEGTTGGIFKKPMADAPNIWLPYVLVDNVENILKKAHKLGAMVVVERKEVPGMGAFGIISDPGGAMLGIWENSMSTASIGGTEREGAKPV